MTTRQPPVQPVQPVPSAPSAPSSGPSGGGGRDELPDRFPLTDLQTAYMVGRSRLFELGGRQNYYLEAEAVDFDPERAEEAVNRVVERHEHLRTVMLEDGYQRVMGVAETPRVRVPVVDLSDLDADRREESLGQIRDRMCEAGLDPAGWPLFEVVVSRIRPHRVRIHIRMSLILLDGSSMRTVITDWLAYYRDPDAQLPPVAQTFREWRLSRLSREDDAEFGEQLAYWRERLDTLPEAPRLPLARQAADIDAVWFTGRSTRLSAEEWRRFCANFRRHRVLPSTALLHVYAEALAAWADTPHFCLNFVHQYDLAYRPGQEEVVGQRSATLPLEVDLRHDEDFWERAQRLQRRLWRDMSNKDVTAVRVSRELAQRNGWTQRAAYPCVFTNNQGPGLDSVPVRRPAFRMVERIQHTPQVLVDNQIRDTPDGGVTTNIDFVEEAFPEGLPAAVVEGYRRMLKALARPDGAGAVPDPVPAEHRAVVAAVNDTAVPAPAGRLEDGFLRRAAARPDAVAVVTSKRTLTYGDLDRLSSAVAAGLRARGAGRGDIVPIVMAKGWEQVVAVLGVLRAGAAYCPVDADLPAERIEHLLRECDARAVLAQAHHPPASVAGLPVLHVDETEPADEPPPIDIDADEGDLAYVIYTSGSTGNPKGVMIEHRGALNTVADINRRIGLGPDDRVFGISSLSFDLSVWDVFGALDAGAALVLPDASARPDPFGWAAAAREHGVTVWNSVPALAEMLVEVIEQRPEPGRPPLRAFLLSGDWIPVALPDRMRALWPGARVIAMGGATEASIWSNLFEVEGVDPRWQSIPYGRPLDNQTMKVLDHRLDIRPAWATGEIYIGGLGLARGYWRDEERTAERFVVHPRTGERLYRTGDLGRYLPDGTIEFLGRQDRQVKIQGFRVEPGEIEAAAREHRAVRECVVCVDRSPGGKRLVAVAVPEPGERPEPESIVELLRARLPRYMVPGVLRVVDRLPLTPNGKVDHAAVLALPADEAAQDASGRAGAPDGGAADGAGDHPLLGRLAELCADLLEIPAIDPDDDFFALGGNSLLALRLVNRIRVELGTDLPMGRVFEAPTVRRLAALLDGAGRDARCMVDLGGGDGDAPELFLFHVLGGAVAPYRPLAGAWPGPVRAFQSRPLVDGSEAAFAADLESMAATYREELQRHRPDGPYLLGGASMGGSLAYEVARQLAERGQDCRVVMFDTEIRDIHPPLTEADRHIGFLRVLRLGDPPPDAVAAIRAAAAGAAGRAARDAAVAHGLLPAEVDVAGYERLKRVQEHELELLAAYRPGPLDRPALLFVAADEPDRPDTAPPWRALCPGIEVESAPGDHFSMIRADRLPALAGRLAAWATGEPPPG
ncbi:non-ribosomal peptide synthetase [Actinomadura sp. WMMB 499]|uniref:non-ribosomal peptide synthetase n=1 Tax=Actinomadura sp. WMMB 499 TaxID=1219491 RepID=UPI00159E9A00|nr:non-ribosomal peptide synthetase [Actinomadura sp. WMMB 499]